MKYWLKENDGIVVSKGTSNDELIMMDMREVSKEEFDSVNIQKETVVQQPDIESINAQVVTKIREKYDINEEFKMVNIGIEDQEDPEYISYREYVDECRNWGEEEKKKFGLL